MTSRERMQEAMEALGPDRFILLSGRHSGQMWRNVEALIETSEELRGANCARTGGW